MVGLGLSAPCATFALDVEIVGSGPNVKPIRVNKVEVSAYPIATAADIVCGKDHHVVRFNLNAKHAGLPFSISAKKMTRIKIRWDHPDKVLFPFPEKRKTIVFPHSGGVSNIYLRAYEPIFGNVYVMDDNGSVIKTCPYSFLPAKRFRQSINVSMGESEIDSSNSLDNDESREVSVNYRISSKRVVPEGVYWSLSVGVSQSENVNNTNRVNSSFSYNW